MSINNLLFSIQNMSPAMLNVGSGLNKTQNYNNLSGLVDSINNEKSSTLENTKINDSVSLTYSNIANKIVSEMASITADTILEYEELDGDYLIALIDDGKNRECRVYSKNEILSNFEGSEVEKKELENFLNLNTLIAFDSAASLPKTKQTEGFKCLASNLNSFLNTNNKTIKSLNNAGHNPFQNMMGTSTLKNILSNLNL